MMSWRILVVASGMLMAICGLAEEALLNGNSLDAWRQPRFAECWVLRDSVLTVRNNPKQKGEVLQTKKDYRDFECELEFRFVSGRIDSGIMIRGNHDQIQIGESGSLKRDLTASPYIPRKGYPVEAKGVQQLLKLKDWNALKIRAVGGDYTTWLNGKEVMRYQSTTAIAEGPIGIQLHGSRVMEMQYRNLRVRELESAKSKKAPAARPKADGGSLVKRVTASGEQAGNPVAHAVDGNPATRWAVNGKGNWLQLELREPTAIASAAVGFTKGNGRTYRIRFDGSVDGKQWQTLFDGASNGRSDEPERFKFAESAKLRFLRLIASGNNENDWINVHTLTIPGVLEAAAASAVAQSGGKKKGATAQKTVLPGKLDVELWAENPLVASPVGISLDYEGRAYVTRVRRRKRSSFDLRQNRGWVKDDLSFQHIDDRAAFYKERAKGKADYNKDGKTDWQDIAGEKEEVLMVWDSDGDGKADKSEKIDEYGSLVTGIAASTLWVNGDLYAAVEPDIWKYVDSDGDGTVDKRQLLATGFSIHIGQGGHNTSGLAVGFDGRIYWSVADKGIHATGADGTKVFLPNRGGVMRCEPDGTNLECFAPGVRNGQELAFDEFGNLFTVDNDGDYRGERERFLYLLEGGEIGWRLNWQWFGMQDFAKVSGEKPYNVWMEEELFKTRWDGQAAYILPPLANYSNGPCGFKYNPGTAINEKYRDYFFFAQGKALHAFRVEPDGAQFKMADEHQITKGPWNTGLAFGSDGALYVCDWMSGPGEKGRVWRVDDKSQAQNPLRLETQALLRAGMAKRPVAELQTLMGHADMRVRRDAQFELVRRNDAAALLAIVAQTESRLARLHGIWGLGQLGRRDENQVRPLIAYLADKDLEVRTHAARVLGEANCQAAVAGVIKLLRDPEPRVQCHAAIALGRLGSPAAVEPLLAAAVANDDADAYVRHAIVMGLATANAKTLAAVAKHPSKAARLVALLALRRQAAPEIGVFMRDADPYLVTETARAIHDDLSIPAALPALAAALERTDVVGEPFLRRAINANFRVGTPAAAARLAAYAAREDAPENMKTTALACLALWAEPPVLDAVEGRYRKLSPRDPAPAAAALGAHADVLAAGTDRVRVVLAQAIERLQSRELLPLVHAMYAQDHASSTLKARLLATMNALVDPQLGRYVKEALAGDDGKLKAAAQKYAAAAGLSGTELAARALATGSLDEQRAALANLAESADPTAATVVEEWLAKLRSDSVDAKLALDVYLAAAAVPTLAKDVAAYEANLVKTAGAGRFALTMSGGDAAIGEELAQGHPAAQCIRCHKINDEGGILGPDLSTIGGRLSPDKMLESLIKPNAEIAEGFGMLVATNKAGEAISGTILETTSKTYRLRQVDGAETTVARADLRNPQTMSAMPPMGSVLELRELRDLIAYLMTLK